MDNPTFHLESIVKDKNELQDFDGPLSLILMLLSKNKIEIRDIKISEILDQYLDYLDQMEQMDKRVCSNGFASAVY
jgi:segregation and condensation protein A